MSPIIDTLWIQVAIVSVLIALIIYQRVKQGVTALNWIIYLLILTLVRSLVEIIINPERIPFDPVRSSHLIIHATALFVLYHYGEYILNESPNLIRMGFLYTSAGLFVGMILTAELVGLSGHNPQFWIFNNTLTPYWEFPFDIMSTGIWTFMTYVFIKMTLFAVKPQVKRQSAVLLIASILFLATSVFELLEHFIGIEQSAIYTTLPGFLFLIFVYASNPQFAYSTPVELYRIIIAHNSGVTISKEILSSKYVEDDVSNYLIGGFLSALNDAYKELTKTSSDLEIMQSEGKTLLLGRGPNVTIILEAQRSTRMLRNALYDFVKEFSIKYEPLLVKFSGETSDFDDYKTIMHKYFPFL